MDQASIQVTHTNKRLNRRVHVYLTHLALDRPLKRALNFKPVAARVENVIQPDKVVHLILATPRYNGRRENRGRLINVLYSRRIERESRLETLRFRHGFVDTMASCMSSIL